MAKKKPGLHKGLDVLLEDLGLNMESVTDSSKKDLNSNKVSNKTKAIISNPKAETADVAMNSSLLEVSINSLYPGRFQPRHEIFEEELESLVGSIKNQGILQPIIVKVANNNKMEILAGERRFRAAKLAGLAKVPVVIKDVTDQDAMIIGLIENMQRENLNPIEEASGVQRLVHEFKLTHEQVAKILGKSRTVITNLLRILGLQEEVKKFLERGDLELSHAKALLALKGPKQLLAAKEIIEQSLTVRGAEQLISKLLTPNSKKISKSTNKSEDPDLKRLQLRLSDKLGASVKILHNQKNKRGKIIIKYLNLDELEGILERIN